MKKIKSILALLCALLFLLTPTFAACGDQKSAVENTPSIENSSPSDDQASNEENSDEEAEKDAENENSSSKNDDVTPPVVNPPASSTPPSTSTPSTPEKPVLQTTQYIRCTGNNVNIRSGAGTDYAVLGSAEKGTMYAIIGKTGNWYKTYYRNKVAYIYASYASVFTLETSSDEDVENVLLEGYKLIGVPYVYGAVRVHDGKGKLLTGFSAQKFDCSSLVQYMFYKGADALLNVNTRTQVTQGKYVAKANLKRGDCLFFTNEERQYKTGIERIGHVAVYLGNDYILHTSSDYARIEKMTASRWKFFVEARRFL